MKKEFKTLIVSIDVDKLNAQEKSYFDRMIQTLKSVDVLVVTADEWLSDGGEHAVFLMSDKQALDLAKEMHLPTVYYSHECVGGFGADMLLMSFGEIGYDFYQQIFDRFHGQPWTILETRRCVLREAVLSDLDVFYEIYGQPSVARYMEALSVNYQEEREKLRSYIKNQYDFYGFGTWTITDFDDNIIGRAGLNISKTTGNVQLGYLIREEYQGQGIAMEVCLAILQYAKKVLEITEVELEVDGDNQASLKLAKKLGFKHDCSPATCCNLLKIYL